MRRGPTVVSALTPRSPDRQRCPCSPGASGSTCGCRRPQPPAATAGRFPSACAKSWNGSACPSCTGAWRAWHVQAVSPGFDRALQRHDDSLLRAAAPGVLAVRGWPGRAFTGSTEVPPPVVALIGLGPGLTPSGDRFSRRCDDSPLLSYVARRLADVVLPSAARDTSLLKRTFLPPPPARGSKVLFDALDGLFVETTPRAAPRCDRRRRSHVGWDWPRRRRDRCRRQRRGTSTASSAAWALEGATTTPASSSDAWRE